MRHTRKDDTCCLFLPVTALNEENDSLLLVRLSYQTQHTTRLYQKKRQLIIYDVIKKIFAFMRVNKTI